MPIGDEAEYVHAQLVVPTQGMVRFDEEHIILTPDETLKDVVYSDGKFLMDADGTYGVAILERCNASSNPQLEFPKLPLPADFLISPATKAGTSYNAVCAVLMQDKRYVYQGQPYAHCTEDGPYTLAWSKNTDPDTPNGYADIYGTGYYGGHGGSGLSSFGGSLRVHELTPTSGPIQHALKVNLYGGMNMYFDKSTGKGYRWPAICHDSYADDTDPSSTRAYGVVRPSDLEVVEEVQMGALLALKPDFEIDELRTEPAKVIAQALMDYGAYIVDDSPWSVFLFNVEMGPNGNNFLEIFEANWGFSFVDAALGTDHSTWSDWAKDIRDIYKEFHVINNNTAETIGGPGNRRVPMADGLMSIQ